MKTRFMLFLLMAASVSALAQVPEIITYHGVIESNGNQYGGTGQFKFALVNDGLPMTITFWSNDGSSVAGSEPTQHVLVEVDHGLFTVQLGDTTLANMTAIPVTVFTNPAVYLRIWFNDGNNGFAQLSPDQRITSVGYAMMSANVPDGAITTGKLADNAVTGPKVSPNAIGSSDIADVLTLQTLNLGGVSWDGTLNLFAMPSGGGGIINPNGEPRGVLAGDQLGSELALFFPDGMTGANLSSRTVGGLLQLRDAAGNDLTVEMSAGGNAGGFLRLRNTEGLSRAFLQGGGVHDGGELQLRDNTGANRLRLYGNAPGYLIENVPSGGGVDLFDLNGQRRISLRGGDGTVHLPQINGDEGVFLAGQALGGSGGVVRVRQGNGELGAVMSGPGSSGGQVSVYDTDGTVTAQLRGAETATTGAQLSMRQANNVETVIIDAEFGANGGGRIDLLTGAGTSTIGMQADGTDATLTGGGILRLGPLTGANLVFDGNEITARNNQNASALFLNPNQGNVVIGGGGELNPPTRLLVESESTSAVDALRVRVGGSTKLYVSGAGQVGVNTTNVAAGFELSVNGQVICTELVVQEPGNWPDYVFAEDYELMPLEALEASIKENKHLPGVPTAAEVKDGGVSIGDMQKQLLEKIEELTLYVIEQNKRLKAQDEQIQSLRAELTAGR